MPRWEVPVSAGPMTLHLTGKLRLSGTDYTYRLLWNIRTARWVFSLYLLNGSADVVVGRNVAIGKDVLARCTAAQRPAGALYAWPEDNVIRDFAREDLGATVKLWYVVE
jgi:hypothetical protein